MLNRISDTLVRIMLGIFMTLLSLGVLLAPSASWKVHPIFWPSCWQQGFSCWFFGFGLLVPGFCPGIVPAFFSPGCC